MSLFSGIEQFGLKPDKEQEDIYSRKKKEEKQKGLLNKKVTPEQTEESMLYEKKMACAICGEEISVKIVRSSYLRRNEPDVDLRPNFKGIDTLKYDVISCPHCGYTAMSRYYGRNTNVQKQFIRDKICSQYHNDGEEKPGCYDYNTAIARYKLSLYNSVVRHGDASEIAFTCLKTAWLMRSYLKEIPATTPNYKQLVEGMKREYENFYEQAFEGFQQAMAEESYPICGMDTVTLDYLLGCMAAHFHQYALASRFISNVLSSRNGSRRVKDKALDLKQEVLEEMKKQKV